MRVAGRAEFGGLRFWGSGCFIIGPFCHKACLKAKHFVNVERFERWRAAFRVSRISKFYAGVFAVIASTRLSITRRHSGGTSASVAMAGRERGSIGIVSSSDRAT